MRRAASYISISLATLFTSAIVVGVGAQGRGGADVSLPEGPGRELVQGTCARCHGLNMITGSWGNDQDGWRQLFGSMVALPQRAGRYGVSVSGDEFPAASRARSRRHCRARRRVDSRSGWCRRSGRVRTIRSPPATDRSGGPASSPTRLGRLDPATGQMKEFPLDEAAIGTARTGRGQGRATSGSPRTQSTYIGKLDPKTGNVTEYPLPDGVARSAHADLRPEGHAVLHAADRDTSAGSIRRPARSRSSRRRRRTRYPYGIQVNSKGVPWFVDFRGNRVGSVDPVTMAIKEYTLPNPTRGRGASPSRRTTSSGTPTTRAATSDGSIRQPAQVKEWPSPGGRTVAAVRHRRHATARSGTANRRSGRTRSCASIRRPRSSRPGSFPPAAASCAT